MTFPPAGPGLRLAPALAPVPQLLRDLVHDRTGVFFESERLGSMLEKMEGRALARGCQSFLDYYYILKYDETGEDEWRRVMDAFSVPETYFWREADQIRLLVDRVVPEWFQQHTWPLRIWSAACATGEEPYSIAIALVEAGWGGYPIEILASDASEAALERARAGLYRERSFRSLPLGWREKYFTERSDGMELAESIRSRVQFRWANLMNLAALPESSAHPVIFCRNVFIYFSAPAIRRVVNDFAERMPPGGSLFIGSSESILKLTDRFELEQAGSAFVYRRKRTE